MAEPFPGEIDVETARELMLVGVGPAGGEGTPLSQALGRTLVEAVRAERDQPLFDVSAMDGYAVRDRTAMGPLRIIGESAAGRPFMGAVAAGESVRIFTGARVPEGCDVIVQERARRSNDEVSFEPGSADRSLVRPAGGDFRAGAVLIPPGVRLDAWRLALAAAAGAAQVVAAPRPRVAILSTGEEIVRLGSRAGPAQIYDSNGPALSSLVASEGGRALPLEPAGDDEAAIAGAVADAACDLIVTVGGASVGDHDLTKPALRRLGLTLKVETVRMRPGKPTWFGVLEDGRRVLGLPGNPASALVCAELFLRPLLRAWQGSTPWPTLGRAMLETPLAAGGPREHWMRASLRNEAGVLRARPFSDQDSSLITVFAKADALVRRPSGAPAAAAGDLIEHLPLQRL